MESSKTKESSKADASPAEGEIHTDTEFQENAVHTSLSTNNANPELDSGNPAASPLEIGMPSPRLNPLLPLPPLPPPTLRRAKDASTEKVFTTKHGIQIRIYVGDVIQAKADAIATGDNRRSNDMSFVTRALCNIPGGTEFKDKRQLRQSTNGSLEEGKVYSVHIKNKEFPFQYVVQAIVGLYDANNKAVWKKTLKHLYRNIYKKVDKKDLRSVAIPLLGTGRCGGMAEDSIEIAVRTLHRHTPLSLEEVIFVTTNKAMNDYVAVICGTFYDNSDESSSDDEIILPFETASHRQQNTLGSYYQRPPSMSLELEGLPTSNIYNPYSPRIKPSTGSSTVQGESNHESPLVYRSGGLGDSAVPTMSYILDPEHAVARRGISPTERNSNEKANPTEEGDAMGRMEMPEGQGIKKYAYHGDEGVVSEASQDIQLDDLDLLANVYVSKAPSRHVAMGQLKKTVDDDNNDDDAGKETKEKYEKSEELFDHLAKIGSLADILDEDSGEPLELPTGFHTQREKEKLTSNIRSRCTGDLNSVDEDVSDMQPRDGTPPAEVLPYIDTSSPQRTSHLEEHFYSVTSEVELGSSAWKPRHERLSGLGEQYLHENNTSFSKPFPDRDTRIVQENAGAVYDKYLSADVYHRTPADEAIQAGFASMGDVEEHFETYIDDKLVQTGNQPPGTMTSSVLTHSHLPGYEDVGIIVITYYIPGGIQMEDHPCPGNQYYGVNRRAYLPHDEEGMKAERMLKIAFDRKLVFTVGRSQSTGFPDSVKWGCIQHKTSLGGGPEAFGYPDPTYVSRVISDLLNLGITDPSSSTDDMNSQLVDDNVTETEPAVS